MQSLGRKRSKHSEYEKLVLYSVCTLLNYNVRAIRLLHRTFCVLVDFLVAICTKLHLQLREVDLQCHNFSIVNVN
jgi:hypothetical protein